MHANKLSAINYMNIMYSVYRIQQSEYNEKTKRRHIHASQAPSRNL